MTGLVCTIGYQSATLPDVVERLVGAGVEVVVDVRAIASSRRAGFSKTLLAAVLAEAGIDYLHLRTLGTPKAGRDAARGGRIAEMHAVYEDHLATLEAKETFADLVSVVEGRKAALLCYETEAEGCHRRVLTERLAAAIPITVQDL
ncbi:MAG: DUF488 domain-containing protein [Pseudomonadota bacterium]